MASKEEIKVDNNRIKTELKDKVVWSHNELYPKTSGGQSCGVMPSDITLYS